MGYNNEVEATAAYGTAVGRFNTVSGDRGVAMGSNNTVTGASGIALGRDSQASATEALAVGLNAQATGIGSVAIGSWSVANRGNAVSFGDAIVQRQLINISAGTASTDAVNLGQLFPVMSALGGGASYAGGVFTAPSFSIQGSNYGSVAAAFSAVDARLTALGSGSGGSGNAVQYDGPARDSVTLGGSGGTRIQNVATGIAPTDAVNVGQMEEQFNQNNAQVRAGLMKYYEASQDYADAGDARTLAASKAYTDQKFAAWNDDFTQRMDVRLAKTDRRIDRIGAMGSAMTHMAVNAANGGSMGGRVAIGIGGQGSQGAVSIGYGKRIGTRASFSFGGSYSGGETTAGAGFGFDL
jgi:autotransporter adhesin